MLGFTGLAAAGLRAAAIGDCLHAIRHHRSLHRNERYSLRRRLPGRLHPSAQGRAGVRDRRRCSTSIPTNASTAAPVCRPARSRRSTTASTRLRTARRVSSTRTRVYRGGEAAAVAEAVALVQGHHRLASRTDGDRPEGPPGGTLIAAASSIPDHIRSSGHGLHGRRNLGF